MSGFSAPLFFRHRRRGKSWALSWKLYFICAIFFALGWLLDSVFNKHQTLLLVLAVLLFFGARIVNFFEYKPLNGKLDGFLKINEDHFEIYEAVYAFTGISHFEFKICDYYGESQGNSSYGGPYSQGVGNWISFTESEMSHKYYFQFYSDSHIDAFFEAFIKLLHNDQLAFDSKYLFNIPSGFGGCEFYREYIGKLIAENKIDCTKGLLLMEYNTDAEAAQLRAKYCQ